MYQPLNHVDFAIVIIHLRQVDVINTDNTFLHIINEENANAFINDVSIAASPTHLVRILYSIPEHSKIQKLRIFNFFIFYLLLCKILLLKNLFIIARSATRFSPISTKLHSISFPPSSKAFFRLLAIPQCRESFCHCHYYLT